MNNEILNNLNGPITIKLNSSLDDNVKTELSRNNNDMFGIEFKFIFNENEIPIQKAYKLIASAIEDRVSVIEVNQSLNGMRGVITVFGFKRKKEKFILPKTDTHFNRNKDRYQFHTLLAALSCTTNKRTAIDIGGHIGFYSSALLDAFDNVIAFEPSKTNAKCFKKNVPDAKLHIYGLGSEEKSVTLNIANDNSGNNSIVESFGGNNYEIEIKTLDSFKFKEIDLIKIDVQGYEEQVLIGAKNTIAENKPILIVELITHKNSPPNETALKLLKEYGYEILSIIGKDYIMGSK